jgi:hypothetical protein
LFLALVHADVYLGEIVAMRSSEYSVCVSTTSFLAVYA